MARRIQRHTVSSKKRKSTAKDTGDPRNWPFLLQDLEASKAIKKLVKGPREFISEAFVRESISRHLGIRPEDVTRNQIRHAVADLLSYIPAITVIPQGPAPHADNEQFQIAVDAAKKLLLCDMQEVAYRLRGMPLTLSWQSPPDSLQPCIRDGFAQFLRIGEKFPNEIGTNPTKWARSTAAEVIIERMRSGPFEVYLPQLLSFLDGEEAKAILLEEAILEGTGHGGQMDATGLASLKADAVTREAKRRRTRGPDKKKHQERVDFEDALRSELAAVRDHLGRSTPTLDELRKRFQAFKLWDMLPQAEQKELLGQEFKPKAYARTLTARKFAVSEDAIKKSRQLLKRDTPSA